MKNKVINQKYIATKFREGLLALLYIYLLNPFYFRSIETFNKLIYYAIVLIPFLLLIIGSIRNKPKQPKMIFSLELGIIGYFSIVLIVMLINTPTNYSYFSYLFRNVLGIVGVYVIYTFWYSLKKIDEIMCSIEELYIKACIIYIFSTIIMLIFPIFKSKWLELIANYGNESLVEKSEYVTRVGLSGFSGFGIAFEICCAIFFLIYLSINNKISKEKTVFYYIMLIVGGVFYGRSGLTICIFESIIWLTYLLFCKRKFKIMFVLLIIVSVGIIFVQYSINNQNSDYINWLLEPIDNYINTGEFSSESTDDLFSMYKNFSLPKNAIGFGTGMWIENNGVYSAKVDVGFLRNLYFGGSVFIVYLYSGIIFFVFCMGWLMNNKIGKNTVFIISLIILLFVFFEFKGDIVFTFIKVFIIWFMDLYYLKNEKVTYIKIKT